MAGNSSGVFQKTDLGKRARIPNETLQESTSFTFSAVGMSTSRRSLTSTLRLKKHKRSVPTIGWVTDATQKTHRELHFNPMLRVRDRVRVDHPLSELEVRVSIDDQHW